MIQSPVFGIANAERTKFDRHSSFPTVNTMRLSLTSALAVTTVDVASASTVYYTPLSNTATGYGLISLWEGGKSSGRWRVRRVREIAVQGFQDGLVDKNYDVFVYSPSGRPDNVTAIFGGAWASDTARTIALEEKDGVFTWAGRPELLYVGTVRHDFGGNAFNDTAAKRFVWNAFNRRRRRMSCVDTTNTWTYTTATWRQANAASANKVEYVCGLSEDLVRASARHWAVNAGADIGTGVGVDSTSVNSAQTYGWAASNQGAPQIGEYAGWPGIGYHYLAWLEISAAVNTTTWRGDNALTYVQSGMVAEVMA